MGEKTLKKGSLVDELLYRLLRPVRVLVCAPADVVLRMGEVQERYDCLLDVATNGPEILRSITDTSYAFVVLDLGLPRALEMLRLVRRVSSSLALVLLYEDKDVVKMVGLTDVFVAAHKPVHGCADVFRLLGLRVREKKDAAYFTDRLRPSVIASAAI